jgi:hypothetical protein
MVFVTMAIVLAGVRQASAAQITQLHAFSGTGFGGTVIDPFDPTLGALDSIRVNITGTLTVTGTTGLFLVPVGDHLQPGPYNYQVDVSQEFFGLGNKFFHFNDPATFTFSGTATGNGEPLVLGALYSYGFTLNATSDLVGFTIPVTSSSNGALIPPLGGISGPRNQFLDDLSPIDEIDFAQHAIAMTFGVPLSSQFAISNVSTGGALELQYNYTPAAAPVPEPGTLGLVGAGVAMLVRRRKKDRTRG